MKKSSTIFFFTSFFFLLSVNQALATARFFFEMVPSDNPKESALRVMVDSDTPVNVLQASVKIPNGYTFLRTNDGGSIVPVWVDKPEYDATQRTLSFSGMIPGGFSGENLPVLTFFVSGSAKAGDFSFVKEETILYENTPGSSTVSPRTDPLPVASVVDFQKKLSAISSRVKLTPQTDIEAPYNFHFYVSNDPGMFEGKYYIVFSAQDRQSGVQGYFVAEQRGALLSDYSSLEWATATSPFVLVDQERKSFAYIKAVDASGNERVGVISPESGLFHFRYSDFFDNWGIILLLCVFAFIGGITFFFSSRRSSRQ